ncbi:MAG: gliding motility-associated C-terminal domain-containing protein [Bacteroidota bacterium]
MNPVAHYISRMAGLFLCFGLSFILPGNVWSQGNVTLTVNSGSSTTTCTDLFSGPEPRWAVQINGGDWVVYPAAGACFNDFPFVQYDETFDCPSDVPLELEVCFKAFEDDGFNCNTNEKCVETICATFPIALPGTSQDYTLALPPGGRSEGSFDFSIATNVNFIGGLNDVPCTAFDLGLIARGNTVGDASLSNYNNFCATNLFEPDPFVDGLFRNDHAVWFSFQMPSDGSSMIEIRANSDPQGLGDEINIQMALYESDNDSCIGNLSVVGGIPNNDVRSKVWRVKCLEASKRYWLLVDGGFDPPVGYTGYFGLEIESYDVVEAADFICDAEDMGAVPVGGSVMVSDQSNTCATDLNDPDPRAFVAQRNVWFSFEAPPSGHVLIEGISDLPPPQGRDPVNLQLALYRSANDQCDGPLEEVESIYRSITFDEQMRVSCLDPGRTYWILIDGAGNKTTGFFDLSVSDAGDLPPQYVVNIDQLLCFGESLQIGDSLYTEAGSVNELLRASNGCDSLVTGIIRTSPEIMTSIDTILCAGASIRIGSDDFSITGSYQSVLTADNGCDSTVSLELQVLDPILVDAVMAQEATGYLAPDGVANVTASGGAGNFTYTWSDGQTGPIAFNLLGGRDYCVTVTDGEGCTAEDCVLIFFPSNILSQVVSDTLDCIGDTDGEIVISISNGAWPYNYSWENADGSLTGNGTVQTEGGSSVISGLPVGNYSITISDGFGFAAAFGEIVEPEPTITLLDTTLCFGTSILVGTDTYDASGQINTVLTSAKGCDSTIIGTLTILPLNETILDETLCFGESLTVGNTIYIQSGPINERLVGANGCDSLVRGNVDIRPEVRSSLDTAVCAGEFIVVGTSVYAQTGDYTDVYTAANGCDSTVYTSLVVQDELTAAVALAAEASALNAANGIARVIPRGGSGSYTYLWSDGQITSAATGLVGGGSYCVTVTDEIGCSAEECIVVLFPVDIRSDIVNGTLDCFGETDGQITFSAYNGQAPYQYSWEALNSTLNGSGDIQTENGTVVLSNLPADQYSLTITDRWGQGVHTMEVTQPPLLEVNLLASTAPQCHGFSDGSVLMRIQGGSQPYFYASTPVDSLFSLNDQFKGDTTYQLVLSDQNGCTAVLEFQLGQPAALSAEASEQAAVRCFGEANGVATVTTNASGARYLWSNGDQTATADSLEAGIHRVTITDDNGCVVEASVVITEPVVPLSAVVEVVQPISCPGEADGSLMVVADGGQNYSYLWSNGSSEAIAEGLTAGDYTITVTDDKGCATETTFSLTQSEPLEMELMTQDVTCTEGEFSGIIQIDAVRGGVGPYEFSIDAENYAEQMDFLQLPSGAYDVYVRDAVGCVKAFPALINDPDFILVSLGDDRIINLGETATLNANTDSNQPIYTWSTIDSTTCLDCSSLDVSPIFSTVYQVTVTDEVSGCTATDELRVTVQKDRNVFIPNVFSPNNDGLNDVFMLYPGIGVSGILQFQVFNRWGAPVYQIQNMDFQDESQGWNGTYKGQVLDPGVYVYFAEIQFKDGEVIQFKGDVTLVR